LGANFAENGIWNFLKEAAVPCVPFEVKLPNLP